MPGSGLCATPLWDMWLTELEFAIHRVNEEYMEEGSSKESLAGTFHGHLSHPDLLFLNDPTL